MLHSVLDLASNYRKPQVKFASYSPEKVMRSVRGIVDDDRCKELLAMLQEAVRAYAERCVERIAELRRNQSFSAVAAASPTSTPSPHKAITSTGSADEDEEAQQGEVKEDAASALDAVRTLAIFVTYFERLQHGIAELAAVWVYANQWCSLQASREIPRSLTTAGSQEASDVFRNVPELFEVALKGYCAVLKAELEADTATLDTTTSTATATTTTTTTATALAVSTTSEVAQLKSSATAADARMGVSELEMLACPPSLEHLTTPLRRRLLFLFTQLTRESQQYNALVEPVVVRLVRSHFESVAHKWWAEELSAKKYFELSETALKHADTVYQQFLHSGTIPLVEDAIQATLIGSVGAEVLKRDFALLMEQEQFHALRLAWRLLSSSAHVRSAPAVVTLFREYLLECGQGIMEELVPSSAKITPAGAQVAARERPFLAVRHLIGLLEQGGRTVEKCFHECEKEFKVALHEALQTILEAYPNAFSEQLAAYQDAIMKEVEVGHVPVSLSAAAAGPKTHEVARASLSPSPLQHHHLHDEENSGPHAASTAATGGEAEEVEEEDRSPLRRPRAEATAPSSTATTTPAQTSAAAAAAAADERRDEEAGAGAGAIEEKDAALGAAALRHAAPLPAEAKEATPVLRRIAYIYSYHPKKDLFEAAYWRDFARRCLHPHRKVDVAAENAFIFYLRDICGLSFTSKFEGMMTDLESSSQLTAQYKTWCQEQTPSSAVLADEEEEGRREDRAAVRTATEKVAMTAAAGGAAVETHLLILAQSFWPKYAPQPPQLYVPPPLQRVTKSVEKFYTGLFPNRHLTWQHPLAHATLRTQLTPQSPVFSLTGTYAQCMVLMRLDAMLDAGVTAVTVKALCDEAGLDCTSTEVLWSLQGLCHPRFRLVLCSGKTTASSPARAANAKEESEREGAVRAPASSSSTTTTVQGQLSPTDVVRLNLDFSSNTTKVRIPLQTRARTTAPAGMDGSGRGARTVDNDGHLVEVAVVSCLKARRSVSHADLVADVNARLPFAVSVPMLKKTMEKMIERGFMVRGKDNTYQFSA
ncbi:hypothetical protein ABB37_05394 [Leptomonas pyrrhocoris]|uniref:Cullin family profile domain-containing protein n=1 Tax=Leptomonas pyrrhocoris TaxID=157538 RepID=A0A0N0DUX5_LEPPY|nr:hypothetical protein ABB37_05394 [Leptomonas pyrrhocoris]KPA79588.1 hypothetical protein ABB37_05394 [Leptomonas pyrrhocoris]|eukprot:XP_015658027.1 hypothetical protein ABB37_05394 [Leptomonas pyrrhocoris]